MNVLLNKTKIIVSVYHNSKLLQMTTTSSWESSPLYIDSAKSSSWAEIIGFSPWSFAGSVSFVTTVTGRVQNLDFKVAWFESIYCNRHGHQFFIKPDLTMTTWDSCQSIQSLFGMILFQAGVDHHQDHRRQKTLISKIRIKISAFFGRIF